MKNIKLEMRGVSKTFPGVRALDKVNFRVREGTVCALCGENGAGKSTLMKILNGVYHPDEGEIFIDGSKVRVDNPIKARELGIAMIFQELSYIPDLTVGENIVLGSWPMKKGLIDWKEICRKTSELLEQEGMGITFDTKMRSLSVSEIQLIEILKAVSYDAKIVIMDEPTSSLTTREIERLYEKIETLKKRGVSIIYISHKMDEVFRIADDITVLRDGRIIDTVRASEVTEDQIIEMMVGRKIENQYPKYEVKLGEEILRVDKLTKKGVFKDISFHVRRGEVVGFAGLMGAGRTETMRAIFGLDPYDSGDIYINGQKVERIKNVSTAIKHNIAMVSEDRRRYGIIPMLSVAKNVTIAALDKFIAKGRVFAKKERNAVREYCEKMNVKTPSYETPISSLSGGNQQKVILARWMIRNPDILIIDEPTRGIDVGAKREIFELMGEFLKEGMGIIMVSSEMPELINLCDRIYVMNEGRITGELTREEFSQEAIMRYAIKKEDAVS
ncbi:MAG: sugar ABC transporter ATP-binding protein [Clostridiales bacterium]|nr:sugar ABC transporter ATP-binding protein [Clostridiales bacterium]